MSCKRGSGFEDKEDRGAHTFISQMRWKFKLGEICEPFDMCLLVGGWNSSHLSYEETKSHVRALIECWAERPLV